MLFSIASGTNAWRECAGALKDLLRPGSLGVLHDAEALLKIARRRGIAVIEDCRRAPGAERA